MFRVMVNDVNELIAMIHNELDNQTIFSVIDGGLRCTKCYYPIVVVYYTYSNEMIISISDGITKPIRKNVHENFMSIIRSSISNHCCM